MTRLRRGGAATWTRVTSKDRDTLAALKSTFPRMRIEERLRAAGRLNAGLAISVKHRAVTPSDSLDCRPAAGPMAALCHKADPAFTHAWGQLKALIHPIAPSAFADLEGPALAEDVAMVEAHLGRSLPSEFKTLLSLYDGQREAGPLPWELAPLHERLVTWQWQNRCGFATDWWSPDWFPILSNGSGDYLVLDLSQPAPALIEYRHDNAFRPVVASSLSSWILQVHDSLRTGRLFGTTVGERFAGLTSTLPTEDGVGVFAFADAG